MKNKLNFIYITLTLLLFYSITACNSGLINANKAQESVEQDTENITESDTGFASFKIVIPDYYAMARLSSLNASRAIAPQTTKVKLSYRKNSNWITHCTVALSDAEKTAIPNAPDDFVGSVYKCSFPNVPSGNYGAGTMKIELLDSSDNVISSGTNDNVVTIITGETTQAAFYTIPTNSDSDSGSLAAGEMKFLRKSFDSEYDYTLSISITGWNSYPDLVIFNENGTFERYIVISADNKDIDCSEYKGMTKYFGFWSTVATSYSTSFLVNLNNINQKFEEELDTDIWVTSGIAEVIDYDPIYAVWEQYGDALVDTHGKVFKLEYSFYPASLKILRITVAEESALSFDYKCDLWTSNLFNVYIDNNSEPSFQTTGYRQMWQKGSVILSRGTHSVKFETMSPDGYYSSSLSNATYIDNITLVPNIMSSVEIYPKGLQETYINGDSIQFSAKALRSDGSILEGKEVAWSATGGSIDENGVFTPGNTAGIYTVTATIDGKTASNQTVKVHGSDYLSDSVIINGHEFKGEVTNGSGTCSDTTNITWAAPTPNYASFTADGFFVLKGTANNTYGYVKVTKDDYTTTYILPPGDFEQRIWLRFGDGEYTVLVSEMNITYRTPDEGYEGAVEHYGSYYTSGSKTMTFTVTNNTGFPYSAEECSYLMPSYICQSDDFIVSNVFNAVIAELPEDVTLGQKLRALHDWETMHHQYDHTSADDHSKRKRQDAVHVVKYGMGVCEGYANLYATLVRLLGIKAAYQSSSSMNHGWIKCYYNGEWKLVDVTWDDHDKSAEETYKYFLIGLNGVDNDHYDYSTDYARCVLPVLQTPHIKDMPDGWY